MKIFILYSFAFVFFNTSKFVQEVEEVKKLKAYNGAPFQPTYLMQYAHAVQVELSAYEEFSAARGKNCLSLGPFSRFEVKTD